jgi:ribosomal protein L37E
MVSISDLLGKNGIFISDSARDQLNIKLTEKEFEALKAHINSTSDPNEMKKCFITNKYFKASEGLMLDKHWVADSLQKTLDSQEKVYKDFKENQAIKCSKCGQRDLHNNKDMQCKKCGNLINIKRYEKSIKLPFVKKIAISMYIKYLKK